MKLVLIALATEAVLARMVTGTWLLALTFVTLYCAIVYIIMQRRLSIKKQDKTKAGNPFSHRINRTRKTESSFYSMS